MQRRQAQGQPAQAARHARHRTRPAVRAGTSSLEEHAARVREAASQSPKRSVTRRRNGRRHVASTGFGAPPMHTMYVAKSLKALQLDAGHRSASEPGVAKAGAARSSIVDYIGITDDLRCEPCMSTARGSRASSAPPSEYPGRSRHCASPLTPFEGPLIKGTKGEKTLGTAMAAVTTTVEWLLDQDVPGERLRFTARTTLVSRVKDSGPCPSESSMLLLPRIEQRLNSLTTIPVPHHRARLLSGSNPTPPVKQAHQLDETSSALLAMVSAALATDGVVDVFMPMPGLRTLSCPFILQ